MRYFYGVVHKDADSAFGIHFPDLPGCFSAADAEDDIVANATEALTLWFEDQALVVPSAVGKIAEAAHEDLADGAFLVRVPYIAASGTLTRINLTIDSAVLNAIDIVASDRKMTRSAFMADAARHEIERMV